VATGIGAALGPPFAIFFADAVGFWSPFVICCGLELLGSALLYFTFRNDPPKRPMTPESRSSESRASSRSEVGDDSSELGSDPDRDDEETDQTEQESSTPEAREDEDEDEDEAVTIVENAEDVENVENVENNKKPSRIEIPARTSDIKDIKDSKAPTVSLATASSKLLSNPQCSYNTMDDDEKPTKGESSSMWKKFVYTMTNRDCLIALLSVFLVQVGYSAIEPHLSQYLQSGLELSQGMVGMVLMLTAVGYMAASPIAGKLADKFGSRIVLIAGVGLCGLGLLLLVPIPRFYIAPFLSAPHIRAGGGIMALLLMSASQGMTFVPALPAMLDSAKEQVPFDELRAMESGYSSLDKKVCLSPLVQRKRPKFETVLRQPFCDEEEAASFLGGVFQSSSQLASAVGPLAGQALVSFIQLSGTEILLGCGLLLLCGLLLVLFGDAESATVGSKELISEKMINSDDDVTASTLSTSFSSDHLLLSDISLSDDGLQTKSGQKKYDPSDESEKDSGEQMYEYGRELILGKDVDPG
jgi:predicted MFS family arabinose efflux permease